MFEYSPCLLCPAGGISHEGIVLVNSASSEYNNNLAREEPYFVPNGNQHFDLLRPGTLI